jgi:hypothetical protein
MRARYWYRHPTWNVACSLSGNVTVTASPWTGLAHHAQGRTACPCLLRGRLAFAMLLPFLRAALAQTFTRTPRKSPEQPSEGTGPAPAALYRPQARNPSAPMGLGSTANAASTSAYGCRRIRIPRGVTTTKHPMTSSRRTERTVACANSMYRRRLSTAARMRITPT